LRERESSKGGEDWNSEQEQQHKNEHGDNDAEEKAQEGPMKPVGFWDPSSSKARKWVILHWTKTSMFNIKPQTCNLLTFM
jgi:hypothetical protein